MMNLSLDSVIFRLSPTFVGLGWLSQTKTGWWLGRDLGDQSTRGSFDEFKILFVFNAKLPKTFLLKPKS